MQLRWNYIDSNTKKIIVRTFVRAIQIQAFVLFSFICLRAQTTLKEAVKYLQKNQTIYFSFDQKIAEEIVNKPGLSNAPIELQLERMLDNTNLTYEKVNNNIYVFTSRYSVPETKNTYNWTICFYDSLTHKVIPDVLVYQKGYPLSFSNEEGKVSLKSTSEFPKIEIRKIGYQTIHYELFKTNKSIHLLLSPKENLLNEVKINATQQSINHVIVYSDYVPVQQVSFLPSIFGRDVLNSLQYSAGVSSVVEPATGLYVRGSPPDQTLTQLDNILIFNTDHSLSTHSFIHTDVLATISFHKKFISSRLGGRANAFLECNSKSIYQLKDSVKIEAGFLGASLLIEKKLSNKVGFISSVRQVMPSGILQETAQILINNRNLFASEQQDPKINFTDGISALSVALSANTHLKLTAFYSQDKLRLNTSPQTFAGLQKNYWKNYGYGTQLSRSWSSNYSSNVSLSFSGNKKHSVLDDEQFFIIDSLGGVEGYASLTQINKNRVLRFTFDNTFQLGKQVITFGVNNELYRSELYSDASISQWLLMLSDSIRMYTNKFNSLSLYSESSFALTQKSFLTVGLRALQFGTTKKTFYEPRFQLKSTIGKINAELYYVQQHQGLIKLTLSPIPTHFNGIWYLNDIEKNPMMTSQSVGLTLSTKINYWKFLVDLYQKNIANLIELKQKYFFYPSNTFEVGKGKVLGLECSIERETPITAFKLDYTFSINKQKFVEIANNEWFNTPFLPRHEMKALTILKLNNFNIAVAWVVGAKRPFALQKPNSAITSATHKTTRRLNPAAYNTQFLSNYHRLDVAINYQPTNKWLININVQNVYNRKNEWYKLYATDKVITKYQIGFLPNLTISYLI